MEPVESNTVPPPAKRRRIWPWAAAVVLLLAAGAAWWWSDSAAKKQEAQAARRPAGGIPVVTGQAEARDVPVRLKANGTVVALQSVDIRAQVTATVREVHIREGQNVQKGDLLFSLDARAEEANLSKAQAQVAKDKADLATAQRNLQRQRELFQQKFISQAALDVAQNQVDSLNGQLAVDSAAVEGMRVARAYMEIRAPFSGRTGAINVRAGSLVQPSQSTATGALPLVTIAQINPITVSFTLPEKELPGLQQAMRAATVPVLARAQSGTEPYKGKLTFVDNAVDTTTGTIRVKAEFPNPDAQLWPGMYANVELAPRTISQATVVPAQAVQTGPEGRFVYTVAEDRKAVSRRVSLEYVEEGFAAVGGLKPGERIVIEGAQNLRPGAVVAEADRSAPDGTKSGKGEGKKGKKAS